MFGPSGIRSRIAAYENISAGAALTSPGERTQSSITPSTIRPASDSEEVDLAAARHRLKKISSTDARPTGSNEVVSPKSSMALAADKQPNSKAAASSSEDLFQSTVAIAFPELTRTLSGGMRSPPTISPKPATMQRQTPAQAISASAPKADIHQTHPLDNSSKLQSLSPANSGGSRNSSATFASARGSPVPSPQIEQHSSARTSEDTYNAYSAPNRVPPAPVLPARLPTSPAASSSGKELLSTTNYGRVAPSLANLAPRPLAEHPLVGRAPPTLQPKPPMANTQFAKLTKSPSAPVELRSSTLPPATKPSLPPRIITPAGTSEAAALSTMSGPLPQTSAYDANKQMQLQGRLPQRSNTIAVPSASAALDSRIRRVAPASTPAFQRLPPRKRSNSDVKSLRKRSSHESVSSSKSSGGATNYSSLGLPVAGSQESLRRSASVSSSMRQATKPNSFPPIGMRRRRDALDITQSTPSVSRDAWLRSPIPRRYSQLFDNLVTALQNRGGDPTAATASGAGVSAGVVREIWKLSRLSNPDLAQIWTRCDVQRSGHLDRDSFCYGLYLVDEELRRRQHVA